MTTRPQHAATIPHPDERTPPDRAREHSLTQLLTAAYDTLDAFVYELDERKTIIYRQRISHRPMSTKRTLAEVAAPFGISRERIRQIEKSLSEALQEFLGQDTALPVHIAAHAVRGVLGPAVPSGCVGEILPAVRGRTDHLQMILTVAGPYKLRNDWLIDTSRIEDDPTPAMAAGAGRSPVRIEEAYRILSEWGLRKQHHRAWMKKFGLTTFNSDVVRPGITIREQMIHALSYIGRPASREEIRGYVRPDASMSSVQNILAKEERIVRTSPKEWGLREWRLSEYVSVAICMHDVLLASDGPVHMEELIETLKNSLGLKPETVDSYSSAPMFERRGDMLALREDITTYRLYPPPLKHSAGTFRLGHRRAGLLIKISDLLLAGNGRTLKKAAASILEIAPEDDVLFTGPHGNSVRISYPVTSIVGPHLGSIRNIARRLRAAEGDLLALTLDSSDLSLTALTASPRDEEPSWDVVGRLTGIENASAKSLAAAMDCTPGQVRKLLRRRGDTELAALIPPSNRKSIGYPKA